MLKQITVFLKNKTVRMEKVMGCLADNNVNIHALTIADATDFCILRMIASAPEAAVRVLKQNNFMVKTADVIAVAMGHRPGSLHKILQRLRALDISIEYMYAFTSRHKEYDAIVIFSVGNQAASLQQLRDSGFSILGEDFLEELNRTQGN